jgi:hypothetical protein
MEATPLTARLGHLVTNLVFLSQDPMREENKIILYIEKRGSTRNIQFPFNEQHRETIFV